ncbi:single-stranded DNA-binding protein [Nocardioides sp. R1-1]|uniref:single-stranded DNA-binding protein n=1 Tax=Nocardioides sp. R1-1 TaxID=3383502 RepID=UPI0038CF3604
MANEPIITVVGNLTADPELRFTSGGAAVANFTVASTPRTKDGDQWVDGEALFIRCAAWRQLGENVAESLTKGMQVLVQGRLRTRSYEHNGEKRSSLELDVDHVGPSLQFATAKVTRAARGQGSYSGGQSQRQEPQASDPWGAPAGDPWASPSSGEPPF